MGLSVLSDESRPVYGEDHRKVLHGHIVDELVHPPLKKCRVYEDHGKKAPCGHPRRHGDHVSFGDPHIEKTVGKTGGKLVQAASAFHCRREADNALIFFGKTKDGFRGGFTPAYCGRG